MSESGGATGITDRIRSAAAPHVGDELVPGLVALVADAGDVHVEALGTLAVGGRPVVRDSLFRIASITKPIIAAATLALMQEGRFGLDDPVDALLPELAGRRVLRRMDGPLDDTVPAHRAITVRDLLTFTLGFGLTMEMFTAPEPWPVVAAANALDLGTLGPPPPDRDHQPDPDTWIARLGTLPLLAQPGERWLYNTGASVLGVLLARAAGAALPDVLRTRLFEPLGMADTGFWAPDPTRLATAYRHRPHGLEVWDEPDGSYSRPPAFGDGAAGLVSCADDLLRFSEMLLGRSDAEVLSPASRQAMTSDQLTAAQKAHGALVPGFFDDRSWGFGLAVHSDGAFGWTGGFGSSWLVDPGRDLVVIVLSQRMFGSPGTPPLHREVQAAAGAPSSSQA